MSTGQNEGKVEALSISSERGTIKHNVSAVSMVENLGILNDAHAGNGHKQVSLLALESLKRFNDQTGFKVKAGEFSENVLTSGINLTSLKIGTRLKVGNEVVLEISQHGKEDKEGCPIFKRVGKCLLPIEGVFAVVIRGGKVVVGDEIEVLR